MTIQNGCTITNVEDGIYTMSDQVIATSVGLPLDKVQALRKASCQ